MLRYFIHRVHQRRFAKPRMVICVPSGITGVEQRAVMEAAEYAGARKAYIIEEPMAAAIGAGLPGARADRQHGRRHRRRDHRGRGHLARRHRDVSQSIRIGGDELDEAIVAFVKKEFSLALGERTAEEIKMALGSAYPLEEELHAEIRGRDLLSGLPKTVIVSTEDIRRAIEEPVTAIIDAVKSTLDRTPPELAADLMEQGVVLTGGGSLLHGLDARLQHETGMPIVVAQGPAELRRDRQWSVPRGVRGSQAGSDHFVISLIRRLIRGRGWATAFSPHIGHRRRAGARVGDPHHLRRAQRDQPPHLGAEVGRPRRLLAASSRGVNDILRPIGDFFAGAVHYGALQTENQQLQATIGQSRLAAARDPGRWPSRSRELAALEHLAYLPDCEDRDRRDDQLQPLELRRRHHHRQGPRATA